MKDSGVLEGSRAAFLKAGASCVSENLARAPKQAAVLAYFKLSSLLCACLEKPLCFFFPPTAVTLLSTSLALRKCSLVGGPFILASIAESLCVKSRKVGSKSGSPGTHAVLQETCSEILKQAQAWK